MIRHISIRDFAIIKKVDIDFYDGLNIITGETGAGKSIVIEAVSLALGSRADTAFIRSGVEKATVQMIADYDDEEYIITREISQSGKNICKINDRIVTLGQLNALCSKLADIHGQYDHQSLLNPDNHITLVDSYNKEYIQAAKDAVAALFGNYSSIKARLKSLNEESAKAQRERDFMSFELQEINSANLCVGEDESLENEISLLQNSERIFENLAGAYQLSSENEYSLLSGLKKVSDLIGETSTFSAELTELNERIKGIYYELEDSCGSIRDCRDKAVFSPEALDTAITRMETIKKLKNKHGKSIEELLNYAAQLENNLSDIENADALKLQLEDQLKECKAALFAACQRLSQTRKKSAADLEIKITEELAQLNFLDAKFSIEFKTTQAFTATGTDEVEFLISTNKGEPLKPLSKIASGGEMSRIMLAFKRVTGDYDEIPTMIFDEIDSGISGIAASVVGGKLREISHNHQIICITHLPQIAAFGSHNYRISKKSDDSMTYTTVDALTHEEKIHEIARLLGGSNITETTIKSAQELVDSSK